MKLEMFVLVAAIAIFVVHTPTHTYPHHQPQPPSLCPPFSTLQITAQVPAPPNSL